MLRNSVLKETRNELYEFVSRMIDNKKNNL